MRQQSWDTNCLKSAKLSCSVNGVNSGLSLCTVNILGVISTCGTISFLSGFVDISILLCNSFSLFSLWIGRISFVVFHSKHMPWPYSASPNPAPVSPCLSLVLLGGGQCLHQDTAAEPSWSWEQNWRVLASLTAASGAVPGISGGTGAELSPFLPQSCCAVVLPSAVVLWEQQQCAQHTLWMCLSPTKSKHWYNPPSVTRLFSPC